MFSNLQMSPILAPVGQTFHVVLSPTGYVPRMLQPACKYGASCYRKNPEHFYEFRHECSNEVHLKFKIGHLPGSFMLLSTHIRSLFDCRNNAFTITADRGTFLAQSTASVAITDDFSWNQHLTTTLTAHRNFSNAETPLVLLHINFAPKQTWQSRVRCGSCAKMISDFDACYYKCINLPDLNLCNKCESYETTFRSFHVFAKVYPTNQNVATIPQCASSDSKLDDIIENLTQLRLEVATVKEDIIKKEEEEDEVEDSEEEEEEEEKKPEPAPAPVEDKPEIAEFPDLIRDRMTSLQTLCEMGFQNRAQIWKLMVELKTEDVSVLLDSLI